MPVDIPLWMVANFYCLCCFNCKRSVWRNRDEYFKSRTDRRAFAFFAYPTYMSGNKVWVSEASNVDAISGETILGHLLLEDDVSYSMFEMFQGAIPGSIAETSTLWVAVGALILIFTGVGSWRIIVGGF